jgi:hypothetical protein
MPFELPRLAARSWQLNGGVRQKQHGRAINVDLLDYAAIQVRNRESFLLNFRNDYHTFGLSLDNLRSIWARLGREKDTAGRSNAGLLVFVNILIRHVILGFHSIAAYQSFLAWLNLRPGLEALLILGKLVDDPGSAAIWKERLNDRGAYQRTFSGKALISKALITSKDFRDVLTHLNDNFVHPNPDFAYRDMTVRDQGPSVILEIQFFDKNSETHEAHLLAYLNLLDRICGASQGLLNSLCDPPSGKAVATQSFDEIAASRAAALATRNALAKRVMEELGLWKFKSSA